MVHDTVQCTYMYYLMYHNNNNNVGGPPAGGIFPTPLRTIGKLEANVQRTMEICFS